MTQQDWKPLDGDTPRDRDIEATASEEVLKELLRVDDRESETVTIFWHSSRKRWEPRVETDCYPPTVYRYISRWKPLPPTELELKDVEIERLRESLQHCINAIAEYEKDSSENIRPFLLGAMDNARKVLNK